MPLVFLNWQLVKLTDKGDKEMTPTVVIILLVIIAALFILQISGQIVQWRSKKVTREKLWDDLCAIGVDAGLAERGQLKEQVTGKSKGKSLGSIEIRKSPICWINLLKGEFYTMYGGSSVTYRSIYVVPGPAISDEVHLKSI